MVTESIQTFLISELGSKIRLLVWIENLIELVLFCMQMFITNIYYVLQAEASIAL